MIDAFIKTDRPIVDVPRALAGFDCSRVLLRNGGGPTEVWQRTGNAWAKTKPGMCLFGDLSADHVEFCAYYGKGSAMLLVDGFPCLVLSHNEGREWLASLCVADQYMIEDAIGCSVNVTVEGRQVECASSHIPMSEFKSLHHRRTALDEKILGWANEALAAGADQVAADITVKSQG